MKLIFSWSTYDTTSTISNDIIWEVSILAKLFWTAASAKNPPQKSVRLTLHWAAGQTKQPWPAARKAGLDCLDHRRRN